MADHDQEQKSVQRVATATAPTAASAEGAMHETRMNVTRQRRAAMRKAGTGGAAPEVDIPEGGGKALDGPVKQSMEKKLGADLSGVNIHTGGASANASEKLNARAFTVGNDVHFNAGQFDPGSKEGTKLLAHELTHVVQGQKGGVQKKEDERAEADAEGKDGEALEVSDPEEPAEQEADAVAEEATADMGEGGAEADGKASGDDGPTVETGEAGGEAKAEGEGGAAETEEKAPEAGAKIKAPISAKLSASALRKLLRKKAFRDEAPAEATAPAPESEPEEEKKPEAEASSRETEGDESEEEQKPSQSVAAKLRGVHRKVFRAIGAPARPPPVPVFDVNAIMRGANIRVGNLLNDPSPGHAALQGLAAGNPNALAPLGVAALPLGFPTNSIEWGLGQLPDGKCFVIRGGSGAVDWSPFPDVVPLAHSHPARPIQSNGGRTVPDILNDGAAAATVLPSMSDVRMMAQRNVPEHKVHTAYRHEAPNKLDNASGSTDMRPTVSFVIRSPRDDWFLLNNPNMPQFTSAMTAEANGQSFWTGNLRTAFHPNLGDMHTVMP